MIVFESEFHYLQCRERRDKMAKYLLGIDLGTSSVRAAVVRDDGVISGVAGKDYPILTPAPGRAEQNPESWWKATCDAIQQAISLADISGKDIAGISFSGQMHGGVFLDNDDNHVSPAIIWADTRSSEILDDLAGLLSNEKFDRIVCNRVFTGTQAATLYWFKRRDPATWRKIRRILLPKDWLRFKMCGLFNTEPSDASSTFLFDVGLREWSKEVLSALDIPIEFLPFVTTSHQHIAETEGIEDETGLPDGIPVILGGADQAAALLGNGILDSGTLIAAIGTGGQLVTPVHHPAPSPDLSLNLFCHLPENRWYTLGATLAGGLCLRWFRDTVCPDTSFEQLTEEAALTPPGADGLRFRPFIGGRRLPVPNAGATGAFDGLTLTHTRGHMVRAVMEGVVCELMELYEIMRKMGSEPSRIIASGGGTKSPVWLQIMADLFGLPIEVSGVREHASFGAALIAGIGSEIFSSYEDAVSFVPQTVQTIEPRTEFKEEYIDLYMKYLRNGTEQQR